jgi:hypothetical protein
MACGCGAAPPTNRRCAEAWSARPRRSSLVARAEHGPRRRRLRGGCRRHGPCTPRSRGSRVCGSAPPTHALKGGRRCLVRPPRLGPRDDGRRRGAGVGTTDAKGNGETRRDKRERRKRGIASATTGPAWALNSRKNVCRGLRFFAVNGTNQAGARVVRRVLRTAGALGDRGHSKRSPCIFRWKDYAFPIVSQQPFVSAADADVGMPGARRADVRAEGGAL